MKTNLKENIWIEGFDDNFGLGYRAKNATYFKECLYYGKTSEIPEEIAKRHIKNDGDSLGEWFKDYSSSIDNNPPYSKETAKESIQSACDKEYCIIYKI